MINYCESFTSPKTQNCKIYADKLPVIPIDSFRTLARFLMAE